MVNKIIQEDVKNIASSIEPHLNKLSGKTLLITGGAGFIGRYFLHTIGYLNKNMLETPCKVICVDNFITGLKNLEIEDPNITLVEHDVRVPLKIDGNVDYIIHAAGLGSPVFYNKFKLETIEVGTIGTKNMLDLSREKNVESFLFFSSSEVYGDPDPNFIPTPETYNGNVSCIGPRACYDEAKRIGETLCMVYFELFKTPIKIVRPFNVYGPGLRLDDYRVIPNFVANALKGNPIPVYGDGGHTRTFCYITDAISGFLKVLLSNYNGDVFNIGNQEGEISVLDLAGVVAEIFDNKMGVKKTVIPNETYASANPKRRCPDITKIRNFLSYQPKINLRVGLKRFVEWAKEEYHTQKINTKELAK